MHYSLLPLLHPSLSGRFTKIARIEKAKRNLGFEHCNAKYLQNRLNPVLWYAASTRRRKRGEGKEGPGAGIQTPPRAGREKGRKDCGVKREEEEGVYGTALTAATRYFFWKWVVKDKSLTAAKQR